MRKSINYKKNEKKETEIRYTLKIKKKKVKQHFKITRFIKDVDIYNTELRILKHFNITILMCVNCTTTFCTHIIRLLFSYRIQ